MLIDRVLIVGLGSIGQRHLRLARQLLPHADIRVLRHQPCDSIPEYADRCISRIEQALDFAPQIAVIASPATFHLDMALSLARTGVHLLVEKPLAASLNGIPLLLESCRAQGLVLLTGYNLRFLPSLQQFRRQLKENRIGRLLSVRCEVGQYLPSWRPGVDYRHGVSARRELGGGVLLELSHELDYLRWIFGEVDCVQCTLSRQSALEIDVEDTAHLILGFMPTDDGRRLVGTVSLDFIRHDVTRVCLAIGESGSLRWNGVTGTVEHLQADAQEWQEVFRYQHRRDESYLAEWEHFLACVAGSQSPLISGEDGYEVVRITEAARLASDSGKQVFITHCQERKQVCK